jgi:hypothetical protein
MGATNSRYSRMRATGGFSGEYMDFQEALEKSYLTYAAF